MRMPASLVLYVQRHAGQHSLLNGFDLPVIERLGKARSSSA
jgi:hypothetical protein